MTGAYERELREVLSGTEKGVNAVIRSCTSEEKARMKCVQSRPFLVVRAAGLEWKEAVTSSPFEAIARFPSK